MPVMIQLFVLTAWRWSDPCPVPALAPSAQPSRCAANSARLIEPSPSRSISANDGSAGQPAHRPALAGPLRDSFAARRVEFLLADPAITVAVEIGERCLCSSPARRADDVPAVVGCRRLRVA
jgi:hypothetical protein